MYVSLLHHQGVQALVPGRRCALQTPPLVEAPNLQDPDQAWPMYQRSDEEERLTVRLSEIYLQVPVLLRPSAHVLRISCGPPMCALDLRQHTHLPVRAL